VEFDATHPAAPAPPVPLARPPAPAATKAPAIQGDEQ
jgi:hypothetical protein